MSHTVHLQPSGRSFPADSATPLLDAALDAGLRMPFGCRNAVCRACEARLLSGRVRYPLGPPAALRSDEVAAGKVLLCQARAESDLSLEVEELAAAGPRTMPCRVLSKSWLAHDVLEVRLALREADSLDALAGQYIDLILRDGRRRAFSVANAANATREIELQLRVIPGGEFSSYAAEHLKERALLRLHGPLGAFYLRKDQDRPVILIAGGTGFAPIKAIIEDALASELAAPMHLYWGVRAQRDLYHAALAQSWVESLPAFRFTPVLSEPTPGEAWAGRTGFVHQAVLDDYADLSAHSVYMSGPPVMIESARDSFRAHALNVDYLYSDSFDYAYVTGHDSLA